jgi:hypothetical protein
MSTKKKVAGVLRSGAGLAAGLVMLLGGAAQAAVVTVDASNSYQDVGLGFGVSGKVDPFDIGAAGAYQVSLADFAFPADTFESLRLIITSATAEYGRLDGPGSFLFNADPGHYFVSLAWDTAGGFDMGLYGVEIAQAVPIPSSALLLLSALGLLVWSRRGRGLPMIARTAAAA